MDLKNKKLEEFIQVAQMRFAHESAILNLTVTHKVLVWQKLEEEIRNNSIVSMDNLKSILQLFPESFIDEIWKMKRIILNPHLA